MVIAKNDTKPGDRTTIEVTVSTRERLQKMGETINGDREKSPETFDPVTTYEEILNALCDDYERTHGHGATAERKHMRSRRGTP